MRTKVLSALVMCLAFMMVFAGCEVVSVNRDKDMAQVLAQVGNGQILKKELYDEANAAFAQYGIDLYDENLSGETRGQIEADMVTLLEEMVTAEVKVQMAEKMEITLNEEETKEAEEEAAESIDFLRMYLLGYDPDNPDDYEGDLEADTAEALQSQGIESAEAYTESIKESKIETKLKEEATKDVTATDEQVKERYDADLKAQKDVFTATGDETEASPEPSASEPLTPESEDETEDPDTTYQTLAEGGSAGSGSYVLYKPAGYRVVKQVLVEFLEADQTKIDDILTKVEEISAELSPLQTELTTAETAKAEAEDRIAALESEANPDETATPEIVDSPEASPESTEKAVADMTDEEKQAEIEEKKKIVDEQESEIETINKSMSPIQTRLNDAEDELEQAYEKAAENLQPKVDEIVGKYDAGTDFNDLIEEYNTDTGMEDGSGKAYGYLITPEGSSSSFITEFDDASRKLTTVGQLSEPTRSNYGVHIIRLEMDDNEADVPFETVKDIVKTKLEGELKDEKWTELTTVTWPEELGVKTHEGRISWIK